MDWGGKTGGKICPGFTLKEVMLGSSGEGLRREDYKCHEYGTLAVGGYHVHTFLESVEAILVSPAWAD